MALSDTDGLGNSNAMVAPLSSRDELEHAWRYFALHAGQRMSMFNYFIILFGLASTGFAGCLRGDNTLKLFGVALGVVLAAISYVFFRLDARTSFLVKHAERVLTSLESSIEGHRARVFTMEPADTKMAQGTSGLWTYGRAFRVVYLGAGGFGIAAAIVAALLRH